VKWAAPLARTEVLSGSQWMVVTHGCTCYHISAEKSITSRSAATTGVALELSAHGSPHSPQHPLGHASGPRWPDTRERQCADTASD
jgi:hypothetical protein